MAAFHNLTNFVMRTVSDPGDADDNKGDTMANSGAAAANQGASRHQQKAVESLKITKSELSRKKKLAAKSKEQRPAIDLGRQQSDTNALSNALEGTEYAETTTAGTRSEAMYYEDEQPEEFDFRDPMDQFQAHFAAMKEDQAGGFIAEESYPDTTNGSFERTAYHAEPVASELYSQSGEETDGENTDQHGLGHYPDDGRRTPLADSQYQQLERLAEEQPAVVHNKARSLHKYSMQPQQFGSVSMQATHGSTPKRNAIAASSTPFQNGGNRRSMAAHPQAVKQPDFNQPNPISRSHMPTPGPSHAPSAFVTRPILVNRPQEPPIAPTTIKRTASKQTKAPKRQHAPAPPGYNGYVDQTSPAAMFQEEELDYSTNELASKDYGDLRQESFDFDPKAVPFRFDSKMKERNLAERLATIRDSDEVMQQHFFASLTANEWEEAGDWFLDQFADAMKKIRESRQAKRQLAERFEQEVASRNDMIATRHKRTEDELENMRRGGENVVRASTPQRQE